MDNRHRRIDNALGVTQNLATEESLQTIATLNESTSPATIAPVIASNTRVSHTITLGKKKLVVQNIGDKFVYWGDSTVTSANGQLLFPKQSKTFDGCEDGFIVYFITSGADTSELRKAEM